MILKTPAFRLSIALVLISINLLVLANQIGLIPDASKSALELRKMMSESLAIQFCNVAEKGKYQIIQNTLRSVVERNDIIRSAAIRTNDGHLVALAGEHLAHWKPESAEKSTPTYVQTPVYRKGEKWATVEIRFAPIWSHLLTTGISQSFFSLLVFFLVSSLLLYWLVIKRTLRELNPSAVIPERVQTAFNILQEGVLILDAKEQILMANKGIADLFGKSPEALVGLKGSELGWQICQHGGKLNNLPWLDVLQTDLDRKDAMLSLVNKHGTTVKMVVNAAKVEDHSGKRRGCLVTFDDITQLEEKNFELNDLVTKLQLSHQEIQTKSKELEFLASRDPLTLCLNRRSFEKIFAKRFTEAKVSGADLSCLMVDIDFFKSVNDRFGHATGDRVIRAVADTLRSCTRDGDLVGRYGGEEFCVVLPGLNLNKSGNIAERVRRIIEKEPCAGIAITVSIGISSLALHANQKDELLNQADKALYVAKKGGRNRVVAWGNSDVYDTDLAQSNEKGSTRPASKSDPVELADDSAQLQKRIQKLEGKLTKQKLEYKHHEMYDPQTGLPSRKLFEDRIAHEIARSKRKESLVAVLSMTIDTVKRLDETLGHRASRKLVKACGDRLNSFLRKDVDTVAMIDGFDSMISISQINHGEFGILLTDIKQVDHVTWVIKRLMDAFEKPFEINRQEIYASVHIGVGISPYDGDTAERLTTSAINACSYASKHEGAPRYLFASQNINEIAMKQLKVESCMHQAIENEELQLYFQPKIAAATGKVAGFEALLRWNCGQLGMIPPNTFIPLLERSGLIHRFGDWVLVEACRHLRMWLDAGLEIGSVAVNMSGIQLRQRHLAHRIEDILKQFDLKAHMLEVELTESTLANAHDKSYTVLKEINALGIGISMDDFGTGYSSLAYLKDIPLSRVKIDRSFIADIGKDRNAEKLLASIISMAHELGLDVVAEGVENQHQADYITQLGSDYIQGYFFGRPLPASEAIACLTAKRAA